MSLGCLSGSSNIISSPMANQVRNESAEDFLSLLKEWEKLCLYFSLISGGDFPQEYSDLFGTEDLDDGDGSSGDTDGEEDGGEVFEVAKILKICYGDPKETKERGLYLKVREPQIKSEMM